MAQRDWRPRWSLFPTAHRRLLRAPGAPIGSDEFCRQHTLERVKKAEELLDALAGLESAQAALHLLRQCASYCKLGYSSRVVPPSAHTEALLEMDSAVRSCLEQVASASLTGDSWAQAQLKLNKGGLGLRSAVKHSPAAYLSSRAKSSALCRSMYAGYTDNGAGDAWGPCRGVPGTQRQRAGGRPLPSLRPRGALQP